MWSENTTCRYCCIFGFQNNLLNFHIYKYTEYVKEVSNLVVSLFHTVTPAHRHMCKAVMEEY